MEMDRRPKRLRAIGSVNNHCLSEDMSCTGIRSLTGICFHRCSCNGILF